jgi:hypothetical protein
MEAIKTSAKIFFYSAGMWLLFFCSLFISLRFVIPLVYGSKYGGETGIIVKGIADGIIIYLTSFLAFLPLAFLVNFLFKYKTSTITAGIIFLFVFSLIIYIVFWGGWIISFPSNYVIAAVHREI